MGMSFIESSPKANRLSSDSVKEICQSLINMRISNSIEELLLQFQELSTQEIEKSDHYIGGVTTYETLSWEQRSVNSSSDFSDHWNAVSERKFGVSLSRRSRKRRMRFIRRHTKANHSFNPLSASINWYSVIKVEGKETLKIPGNHFELFHKHRITGVLPKLLRILGDGTRLRYVRMAENLGESEFQMSLHVWKYIRDYHRADPKYIWADIESFSSKGNRRESVLNDPLRLNPVKIVLRILLGYQLLEDIPCYPLLTCPVKACTSGVGTTSLLVPVWTTPLVQSVTEKSYKLYGEMLKGINPLIHKNGLKDALFYFKSRRMPPLPHIQAEVISLLSLSQTEIDWHDRIDKRLFLCLDAFIYSRRGYNGSNKEQIISRVCWKSMKTLAEDFSWYFEYLSYMGRLSR